MADDQRGDLNGRKLGREADGGGPDTRAASREQQHQLLLQPPRRKLFQESGGAGGSADRDYCPAAEESDLGSDSAVLCSQVLGPPVKLPSDGPTKSAFEPLRMRACLGGSVSHGSESEQTTPLHSPTVSMTSLSLSSTHVSPATRAATRGSCSTPTRPAGPPLPFGSQNLNMRSVICAESMQDGDLGGGMISPESTLSSTVNSPATLGAGFRSDVTAGKQTFPEGSRTLDNPRMDPGELFTGLPQQKSDAGLSPDGPSSPLLPAAPGTNDGIGARSRRKSSWQIIERLALHQFRSWVAAVCIVTFDLEVGQALELVYPPTTEASENSEYATHAEGDVVFDAKERKNV
ncbi:MAG: hypothetical protein BJ554DRAFT_4320 [Olpidium bornovanus]|uniref:Uncharacterized protein n=1 Tax=Olpidium bornovanus TaxID=278681 RepID=A0A8H7ZMW1_9FUNG|nr:MAG: hypothetical protein BJ554DRAFT_4320 [Olpidium bornovanus]